MNTFDYLRPASIDEALQMLNEYGEACQQIAGGTDLMVDFLYKRKKPRHVVDLLSIPELTFISQDEKLRIGATTSLDQVDRSERVRASCQMLSEGAALVGSQQIRNLATLGGNICNAVPSADTAPPLLAANADVFITGPKGNRIVNINDFFIGPRKSVLAPDEIVVEIAIEPGKPYSSSYYQRHTSRMALDLAKVGVAVYLALKPKDGSIDDVRIALGAVAPTPVRALEAEEFLVGNFPDAKVFEEAARLAKKAASPITDVRSTETHRREIVGVFTKRCLEEVVLRAKSQIEG